MPAAALRDSNLRIASIGFNSTGDNTVIAAVANQGIRIYKIFFVADASTNIIFKNGSTALSGTIPLFAGGAFVLDTSNDPWFMTSVGSAFVINQSGTSSIGGMVYFHQP